MVLLRVAATLRQTIAIILFSEKSYSIYLRGNVIRCIALIGALASALTSCEKGVEVQRPVVQVGTAVLSEEQLSAALPSQLSPADSAVRADDYVRAWVRRQVLLSKAQSYLQNETNDIERAVEEYRSSLIIETYQNKLVEQKFVPNVTESDIAEYYEANKRNFKLRHPIFRGVYAVLPKGVDGLRKFKKQLESDKDESAFEVEQYLFKNSTNYKVSADAWLALPSVLKFFPSGTLADNADLKSGSVQVFENDSNVYAIKVIEIFKAGAQAPLDYVSKDISNILVAKRKLDFLQSANNDIYEQAVKDNIIKYFDK